MCGGKHIIRVIYVIYLKSTNLVYKNKIKTRKSGPLNVEEGLIDVGKTSLYFLGQILWCYDKKNLRDTGPLKGSSMLSKNGHNYLDVEPPGADTGGHDTGPL